LLKTIENRNRYEPKSHQGYLLNPHHSPSELKQLQHECKLLGEKLKGNAALKRMMRDSHFISSKEIVILYLAKLNLDSDRSHLEHHYLSFEESMAQKQDQYYREKIENNLQNQTKKTYHFYTRRKSSLADKKTSSGMFSSYGTRKRSKEYRIIFNSYSKIIRPGCKTQLRDNYSANRRYIFS